MRITEVLAESKMLPYKDSNWKIATGSISGAMMIFVHISTDEGYVGHGCTTTGAFFLSGESEVSVVNVINEVFSKLIIGRNPFDIEDIMKILDKRVILNYRAKAGIDIALHDLVGQILKVPIRSIMGNSTYKKIPVMRMVSIKDPKDMAKDASLLVDQGYKALKIKIGEDHKIDLHRISEIRNAIAEDVTLTVDINQAYSPKNAVRLINELEQYDVAMIEQPVNKEDIIGMAYVRQRVNIPIEADESVLTLANAAQVIERKAVDFISIKPVKVGGLNKAKKIAALCEAFNVGCVVGTVAGSQMIDAANAQFIASTPNVWWAAEIGEFVRLQSDPASGLKIIDGFLEIPDGPGLGVKLDI